MVLRVAGFGSGVLCCVAVAVSVGWCDSVAELRLNGSLPFPDVFLEQRNFVTRIVHYSKLTVQFKSSPFSCQHYKL